MRQAKRFVQGYEAQVKGPCPVLKAGSARVKFDRGGNAEYGELFSKHLVKALFQIEFVVCVKPGPHAAIVVPLIPSVVFGVPGAPAAMPSIE
jgi:hypothetical protein